MTDFPELFNSQSQAFLEGQACALADGSLSQNPYGSLQAANGTREARAKAKKSRQWAQGFESVDTSSDMETEEL